MINLVDYISEKLLINKEFVSPFADKKELSNDGWKNIKLEDVDPEFADVEIDKHKCDKKLYRKDGSPTQWFLWWMILCIYGPMSKKELLNICGFKETSYTSTWSNMSLDNVIYYDSNLRKSRPNPMSEWNIWK